MTPDFSDKTLDIIGIDKHSHQSFDIESIEYRIFDNIAVGSILVAEDIELYNRMFSISLIFTDNGQKFEKYFPSVIVLSHKLKPQNEYTFFGKMNKEEDQWKVLL